mmetsp:Transcript_94119/g.261443  ORF Transcript_94119/g.261443 Transcript_94119/m.261443 type:complete len:86 (+) Transcript_94119:704-961(+)
MQDKLREAVVAERQAMAAHGADNVQPAAVRAIPAVVPGIEVIMPRGTFGIGGGLLEQHAPCAWGLHSAGLVVSSNCRGLAPRFDS